MKHCHYFLFHFPQLMPDKSTVLLTYNYGYLLVSSLHYSFMLFLYVVAFLLSPCFRSFIRAINPNIRLRSSVHERKYFYWIILLIKEMSLVIIHVLLAFLYKWFRLTNNDDRIISMNFHRWLVEASFAPFLAGGY
jgi:hypothetical protein